MQHEQYKRISGNGGKAILFIHGIVGTPRHFDRFVALVPEHISVYNVLLDGHGKSVRDFGKTSMKTWEAQITAIVEELAATHKEIYIVGHSMGTLLAIEQALKNEKVTKLFLLAVPLRVMPKGKMWINIRNLRLDKIAPDDLDGLALQQACGVEMERSAWRYVCWIPRYMELFAKIRRTRKVIGQLQTPCQAYQSRNDEMVLRRSVKCLQKNPQIRVEELQNSGHYRYAEEDWAHLSAAFEKMLG